MSARQIRNRPAEPRKAPEPCFLRLRLLRNLDSLVCTNVAFPYYSTGGIELNFDVDRVSISKSEMPFRHRQSVVAGNRLTVIDCHLFVPE